MGLFGGSQARSETYVPYPARATWRSLCDAVTAHPSVTTARFNDLTMQADFKTTATYATYGQNLTAVVTANGYSTHVEISGAAKLSTLAGRDQGRIRKIAAELFVDLTARLSDAPGGVAPGQPTRTSPLDPLVREEIAKFELLRARGFISTDEFNAQKRQLLSNGLSGQRPIAVASTRGPQRPARDRIAIRFVR